MAIRTVSGTHQTPTSGSVEMIAGEGKYQIVVEAFAMGFVPCGLREFMTRLGGGIGRRAASVRRDHGVEFTFLVPKGMSGVFGPDVRYREVSETMRYVYRAFPMIKCDLYHTPHQYCTFKQIKGASRHLMTVHDINFIHTKTGARLKRASLRFRQRMAHASHLAFISEFAKSDVERAFPFLQPYRVIYNGVKDYSVMEQHFGEPHFAGQLPENGFLFHLSSLEPYKNAELLVEMMRYLPDRTLVIAGRWAKNPDLRSVAVAMPNVVVLDSVSEDEKAWLYSRCTAFLFPSSAEGFGLPPLEVMKFGKPVFLSKLTSLPETGGSAAYYWQDLVPEKMAAEVTARLSVDADREALLKNAARFDWDKCADEYIEYYLSILGL